MAKEIIIEIDENGEMSIEGIGLRAQETISDVAKDFTSALGKITEKSHKHTHNESELNRNIQRQ